jgi:hypothetical protein
MNELAEIVSDIVAGSASKSIEIRGRFYTVKPPTTVVLAKMLKPLSKMNISEGENSISVTAKMVEQSAYIDEAIALAVVGDVQMSLKNRLKLWRITRDLSHASEAERKDNFATVVSLLGGKDFFDTARLAMEVTGMVIKQKPLAETH